MAVGVNSFSGGDGKFSYKNALKSKNGQKKKKAVNLEPIQGLPLLSLLEGFPPLESSGRSSGFIELSSAAPVAADDKVEEEAEEEEEQEEVEEGEEDGGEGIEEKGVEEEEVDEMEDNQDSSSKDNDVVEEQEEDEQEEKEGDGEDDITRYQREIEEQHTLKEGLKSLHAPQTIDFSTDTMDDLLMSSLLKVRTYV